MRHKYDQETKERSVRMFEKRRGELQLRARRRARLGVGFVRVSAIAIVEPIERAAHRVITEIPRLTLTQAEGRGCERGTI